MGKERYLPEPASNLPRTLVEAVPVCLLASNELQKRGISVTTQGIVRTTTITAYCLISGESPKELYQRGSLQAALATWGWGMWLNDYFDRFNTLEYQGACPTDLLAELRQAQIKKNGHQISLMAEADLIVDQLPEGIQEAAKGAINKVIINVAQEESHRPSLLNSPPEEIFTYRFRLNQAYALPLIDLLSFPNVISSPIDPTSNRTFNTLIPFMQATCEVDDVVGITDDLRKGLLTYGTWALRETGDYQPAVARLRKELERQARYGGKDYPAGYRFLQQFPETKKLLRRTFIAFMTAAPDQVLHKAFRAGAYALWKTYPPLYQGLLKDLMGHNGAKGRQVFV